MHSNIIVEYVCECDNAAPVAGDKGNYTAGKSVTIWDHCRVICLNCGKDMKLQVSKEELKTEVTVISETK